jgi:O-glycosyl hydrolase
MDAIGFSETKIIIPDGGDVTGIEKAMLNDSVFAAAVDGLGVHCTTVPTQSSLVSLAACIPSPTFDTSALPVPSPPVQPIWPIRPVCMPTL